MKFVTFQIYCVSIYYILKNFHGVKLLIFNETIQGVLGASTESYKSR